MPAVPDLVVPDLVVPDLSMTSVIARHVILRQWRLADADIAAVVRAARDRDIARSPALDQPLALS